MNYEKLLFVLLLTGCATTHQVALTTKTIPVEVPILYCPAPPEVQRPPLLWGDKDSDGELVLHYAGTMEELIGYSEQLEKIVEEYKQINAAYNQQADKTKSEWK